jgi:hypothetical protein
MIVLSSLVVAFLLAPQRDTAPVPQIREATARVTFDFGTGTGASAPVVARALEVSFASGAPGAPGARARCTKEPDALTSALSRYAASGAPITSVLLEILDGDGKPLLTLRLGDAVVASDRLVLDASGASLEQQRLNVEEAVAQLAADLLEAQRQYTLNDALEKKRATSSLETARAKEKVELLQTRLGVQRRRLAILQRQIGLQTPVNEEVTLVFSRFEVEGPQGAKTAWGGETERAGRAGDPEP